MRCSICGETFGTSASPDQPRWKRVLEIPGAICSSCCPSKPRKKTG